MKKYFLISLGITFGLILGLATIGGGIYWWVEVRPPAPTEVSVELDGFPGTGKNKDGKEQALLRIVVTNNEDYKLSINDAYLYLTRVSDGARTDLGFDVDDMVIYPKERYVDIVETMPIKSKWLEFKGADEFESKDDYLAYREKWISQLRETYKFNFSFVSDKHNIRIVLNTQEKIAEIESKDDWEKNEK